MNQKAFIDALQAHHIPLNEEQIKQFDSYIHLIQEANQVMNLTTITEEDEMYEKHFYDSLLFTFGENITQQSLLDVGSGAGLPGIPLAITYPHLKVTLLEPMNKRAKFLENTVQALQLKNVTVCCDRGESFSKKHHEEFDIVTARAVSKLNILMEVVCQLVKVGGTFVALKGKIAEEELEEASKAIKTLGFQMEKNKFDFLPSDSSKRDNIFIKKIDHTSGKYPRNYGQIKSRPL